MIKKIFKLTKTYAPALLVAFIITSAIELILKKPITFYGLACFIGIIIVLAFLDKSE